jgi:transcriptional antiterminator Rof (Rho-off)
MRLGSVTKLIVLIAAGSGMALAAHAQDLKSMQLANELGSVLASEESCGLSYDQVAIRTFIEKHVRADDMSFANTLNVMTQGAQFQLKGMSASAKTAHCTQISRVARTYGFTK